MTGVQSQLYGLGTMWCTIAAVATTAATATINGGAKGLDPLSYDLIARS
jgi:hypothetical protein